MRQEIQTGNTTTRERTVGRKVTCRVKNDRKEVRN